MKKEKRTKNTVMNKKIKVNKKSALYNRMSKRTVKKTLRHTFATIVATSITLILFCVLGLQFVKYYTGRLNQGPLELAKYLSRYEIVMSDMESSTYEAILGAISPEEMKERGIEDGTKAEQILADLENAIIEYNDPRTMPALDNVEALKQALADYSAYGEKICGALEVGNPMLAKQMFTEKNAELEASITENTEVVRTILEEKQALYMKNLTGFISLVRVVVLFSALCCAITAFFIIRNLCGFMDGSLERMMDSLKKVAAGDLNAEVVIEGNNEFTELATDLATTINNIKLYIEKENDALAQMAEKDMSANIDIEFAGDFAPMKQAVNDITVKYNDFLLSTRDAAVDVSGAASNMSNVSQNLASASTQQAASVQELLAIIENLNDHVKSMANSVHIMSQDSIRDNQDVVAGNAKMQELVTAMDQIEKSSKQIYGIVEMIEEIARKTSMLSLNASIEAARAGDQGKGFAVVAEEIRSLAEASTDAVHKISELVGSSLEAVEQGSNIAQDTASLFDNIVKNGEAQVEKTHEISKECSNQSDTLHSVMCGVQEIAATVESNSQLAEEASATSQQLFSSAQLMQAELDTFKLVDREEKAV